MKTSKEQIKLNAPAKINLALSVGGAVSSGDKKGYHPIASWMAAIDFCDLVTATKSNSNKSTFQIEFASNAPIKQEIDWPIEKDLAFKARKLIENHVQKPLPIEVRIEKNIPAGMGLAGGSADAAALFLAVNKLYELNLTVSQLVGLAKMLGCDVAFSLMAMTGKPQQIATGYGEKLENITNPLDKNNSTSCNNKIKNNLDIALILPQFFCSTAQVYREFDRTEKVDKQVNLALVKKLASNGQYGLLESGELFNDLKKPAMCVQPKLQGALTQISKIADSPVHVTGSGAGMFIITSSQSKAKEISSAISKNTSLIAMATRVY